MPDRRRPGETSAKDTAAGRTPRKAPKTGEVDERELTGGIIPLTEAQVRDAPPGTFFRNPDDGTISGWGNYWRKRLEEPMAPSGTVNEAFSTRDDYGEPLSKGRAVPWARRTEQNAKRNKGRVIRPIGPGRHSKRPT